MTRNELLQTAKPILFNTGMVKAILDGRKTVTRRAVKPRYRADEGGFQVVTTLNGEFIRVEKVDENECGIFADGTERIVSPPYNVGEILYVRETWAMLLNEYAYRCGYVDCDIELPAPYKIVEPKWHPSIHMPKEAARLFLRVTDVRVERLQDMNLDAFLSEGVSLRPEAFNDPDNAYLQARHQFSRIWDSTIKKPDRDRYGWNANPWVWVIEFERVMPSDR